jgi:hypothetical protein
MATSGPSTPTINVGITPTDGIDFSQIDIVNVNSSAGAGYAPEYPQPPFKVGTHPGSVSEALGALTVFRDIL